MGINRSIAGLAEKDGLFFLAKRKPGGDLGGKWELPGGKLEEGETPQDAMLREWQEELEIEVSTGKLVTSTTFSHNSKEFLLEVYNVSFQPQEMTLNEHVQTGWFSREDINDLDLAGSDRKALSTIWDEVKL